MPFIATHTHFATHGSTTPHCPPHSTPVDTNDMDVGAAHILCHLHTANLSLMVERQGVVWLVLWLVWALSTLVQPVGLRAPVVSGTAALRNRFHVRYTYRAHDGSPVRSGFNLPGRVVAQARRERHPTWAAFETPTCQPSKDKVLTYLPRRTPRLRFALRAPLTCSLRVVPCRSPAAGARRSTLLPLPFQRHDRFRTAVYNFPPSPAY